MFYAQRPGRVLLVLVALPGRDGRSFADQRDNTQPGLLVGAGGDGRPHPLWWAGWLR
ncbi:MAG: hypothetical protein GYB68_10805 [Chloroflexi bacterium]|nr:hypothetical protein [Chloroflexota bacterium]